MYRVILIGATTEKEIRGCKLLLAILWFEANLRETKLHHCSCASWFPEIRLVIGNLLLDSLSPRWRFYCSRFTIQCNWRKLIFKDPEKFFYSSPIRVIFSRIIKFLVVSNQFDQIGKVFLLYIIYLEDC